MSHHGQLVNGPMSHHGQLANESIMLTPIRKPTLTRGRHAYHTTTTMMSCCTVQAEMLRRDQVHCRAQNEILTVQCQRYEALLEDSRGSVASQKEAVDALREAIEQVGED